MYFSEFSQQLSRLEQTASRLDMTEILADLFRQTQADEIGPLVYLSLGQLRPKFNKLEFSLAEKMVMRSIALAVDMEQAEVLAKYKQMGDLGEVVESTKFEARNSKLSLIQVFHKLEIIAEDSGQGSQERKVAGLADLFRELDPLSCRYIARMVLGKLRLGFSDMTVIDALSYLVHGDKSGRKELEEAYQLSPDIGNLASLVKQKQTTDLTAQIRIKPGVPVIPALAQRLKTAKEMIEKMGKVYVDPKYDGTRCISGYTGLFVKDRGYLSVREVEIGDEVLTHKGRFKPILAKQYRFRKVGEQVFVFKSYLGDEFKVSEGHKFLVSLGEGLDWVPVESITDNWVYFPKPKISAKPVAKSQVFSDKAGYKKIVDFSTDFFRFLGYWVGDGFSNNSHQSERIGLVFNANDTSLVYKYESIARNVLGIEQISKNNRNGAINLYWRDPVMRKWLCKHFRGENDSGKKIPDWFFGLDTKRFNAFLDGWIEADGSNATNGQGKRIVTKERQLAMMGQILGFMHDRPLGVSRFRAGQDKIGQKTYYLLTLPGGNRYIRPFKNGYLIKIRRLKDYRINGKLRLYDIQVEGDESFCVSSASLHNCQIHFDRTQSDESSGGLFEKLNEEGAVKTFTRNLDETSHMFPELAKLGDYLNADEVILDAEAMGYDPETGRLLPFQQTIQRKRKHGISDLVETIPLKFFAFDILYKDGVSLLGEPLYKRYQELHQTVKNSQLIEATEFILTEDADEIRAKHADLLAQGLEGAMVKKWDGIYNPGRKGWSWVKFKEAEGSAAKLSDTVDAVVMGLYVGRGKRAEFGVGAFLIGLTSIKEIRNSKSETRNNEASGGFVEGQFYTISKVGTGLTDEQWIQLKVQSEKFKVASKPKEYEVDKNLEPDVWLIPGLVVEIAADEITKSPIHTAGLALRFPRLVKFRDDKGPEQVTSIQELEGMV